MRLPPCLPSHLSPGAASRLIHPLRPLLLAAVCGLPLGASALTTVPAADLASWACTGVCGSSAADGDIMLSPLGNPRHGYVATAGSAAYGTSPVALDSNSRGSGTEANGSKTVSPSFSAAANDTLSVHFNYLSTDGKNYDDYAWARIVDAGSGGLVAWLFVAQSNNSSTGQIVPGDVVDRDAFDPDEVIVDFGSFSFTSKTVEDPIDWTPLGGSNGSCWRDNAEGCGYTGWLQARHRFAASGSYRLEVGVVNWGDEAYDSGLAFDYAGLTAPVPEPGTLALALAGLVGLGWRVRQR